MKALIVVAILFTIGLMIYQYKKDKSIKKLLITLLTFAAIISLAIVGNLTRPVMPIFIAHEILVIIAWAALFVYIFKERYHWWWFLSPLATIGLFLVLEFLAGSGHELA